MTSSQELPPDTIDGSLESFKRAAEHHLYYTRGQAIQSANPRDALQAVSLTVRHELVRRWRRTVDAVYAANPKFVYYLSAEYLLGRQLPQNLLYTGTTGLAREGLEDYGLDLDELIRLEREPGLGNGGLGRLAACYLDSMATLDIPSVGYGIRYEYGIFRQSFRDGWQVEGPDVWLRFLNPWEFPHPDDSVAVCFGGHTESYEDEAGHVRVRWNPAQEVFGEPYHTLVPGYGTSTVNLLRLWKARASREFDFRLFDEGDYARAVEQQVLTENISKVLYPNDDTPQGRELRLKQQYFFVACSLHDIVRRFHLRNSDWDEFPDKVVIQLNDTHPVIAIPELMRILIDIHQMSWARAWDITSRTFASTQHTLLPEALEKWPVSLIAALLPRHLELIYEINRRFLDEVRERFPDDPERVGRMSIIEEFPEKTVRMAHLANVGSFSINGVAELQSRLLRDRVFRDFYELWPEKFTNVTNGVTPRRFLRLANPELSSLITDTIGDGWLRDLDRLEELVPHAEDPAFQDAWREVKQHNKQSLARYFEERPGITVDAESMFDVMVKRLHEYKRQLLKAMHIISLYQRIKDDPAAEVVSRTFIFGAKAAPGYRMAKLIIKLINSVAEVVNDDPAVAGRLKVVFVPNFNVSRGQRIYPAADVSEQISMAGKEASGTGNMKFALNGAITCGTLDGANIEIRERVGAENFFLFGLDADEAFALTEHGYDPMAYYEADTGLRRVVDAIGDGRFSRGDRGLYAPLVDSLLFDDQFLVLADYRSYVDCQDRISQAYMLQDAWTRMSILNSARCGFFSSDRAISQYAADIWQVAPVPVPEA